METIWSQIIILIILIFFNALFSSAEIAMITLNDMKLKKMADDGNKKAIRLSKLIGQPAQFLSTIQIGITIAGFLGSAFAAQSFASIIVNQLIAWKIPISVSLMNTLSVLVVTLILSYFTLVFGELVPKRVAMHNAEGIAMGLVNIIYFLSKITKPIVWFLTKSTNFVLRLFGIDPNADEEAVTEEEIRMMVDVGLEKGTIDLEEKRMINNIFEFDDQTAEEVMIHRMDMDILWMEDDVDTWRHTFENSDYYDLPVCGKSADDIIGVLNVRSFYQAIQNQENLNLKQLIRYLHKAEFIPSYLKLDQVFKLMQEKRVRMAIMIDEHGGVDGFLTMNDLLEEIVGDIEFDEDHLITQIDDHTYEVKGELPLDLLEEELDVDFGATELMTIGGLVVEYLGQLPEENQKTDPLIIGKLKIEVTGVKYRRITNLRIEVMEENKTEEDN